MTLDEVVKDVLDWQRTTFGLPSLGGVGSAAEHLRREAEELADNPTDTSEVADVCIMLVRVADNLGIDLAAVVAEKLAINRRRVWRTPDQSGVVEHVREVD